MKEGKGREGDIFSKSQVKENKGRKVIYFCQKSGGGGREGGWEGEGEPLEAADSSSANPTTVLVPPSQSLKI